MLTHGVAGSACLVGLGTILPLLIYQIDYDVPLGFPNELVLVVTAVLIGAAGPRRTRHPAQDAIGSAGSVTLPLLAAGGALVLVGSLVAGAAWVTNPRTGLGAPSTASSPASGVVVSWNLHYAVSPAGSLDLEAIARTIEAQDPDAVLLQEVSRGWVMGGGVDLATWLSNRLGQEFVFAPAADRQFGNVVMSDRGLQDVEAVDLPFGAGPQNRSAISAMVPVGGIETTVTSVHLQSKPDVSTRLRQIDALLGEIGPNTSPATPRVVGGDFNAEPGSPEIALMTGAGFVSAVDEAGDPTALTSPSVDPRRRIDWVFGRGVTFSDALVPRDVLSADHLPVIVTVAPKP
jgi:endonuclease/exonuclease/phosphatase family metal-dependent hydrolase